MSYLCTITNLFLAVENLRILAAAHPKAYFSVALAGDKI